MRYVSIQSAAIAATGVLVILYLTFSSSFRSLAKDRLQGWRNHEPPAQESAKVFNNPYTEWYLVWQKQVHSHTLVIATMRSESVTWLDEELADLPNLQRAIYVVDDETAPLHTPTNKGNEAMAYLSYLIDFYDDLPDVSTFVHSHRATWHISELLNRSAAETIHRLSLEKVVREGYVNLRCDLLPGCPVSTQLDRIGEPDTGSRMNEIMAAALLNLFPGETVPNTLAQPCCAQFAVSREAIRRHSKEFYASARDWLVTNDFPNEVSGRVFEYVWHYLFTSKGVVCPSEQLCYCDAYAICFPSAELFQQYNGILVSKEAFLDEERVLPPGENNTRRKELKVLIDGMFAEADKRKQEALSLGSDPFSRQKILYDAWEVLKTRGEL